jgi:hypothetical protein
VADRLTFQNGAFQGKGHWIDQKTEGDYSAACTISNGLNGSSVHVVKRVFLKPDGATLYEENTTQTFEPAARNAFTITIASDKGSLQGRGYCFDKQYHYELDISANTHAEFTIVIGDGRIDGLGSSTNKGNFTSWRETLFKLP